MGSQIRLQTTSRGLGCNAALQRSRRAVWLFVHDMRNQIRESRPRADRSPTCQLVDCPRAVFFLAFALQSHAKGLAPTSQLVDVVDFDGRRVALRRSRGVGRPTNPVSVSSTIPPETRPTGGERGLHVLGTRTKAQAAHPRPHQYHLPKPIMASGDRHLGATDSRRHTPKPRSVRPVRQNPGSPSPVPPATLEPFPRQMIVG